jgi:hypothetical protein
MRLRSLYRRFPSYRKRMYVKVKHVGVVEEKHTWYYKARSGIHSRMESYRRPSKDDYRPFINISTEVAPEGI